MDSWYFLCLKLGFANRGMASSRFNFFGMTLFFPLALYWGYTRPVHRKLYTEILTTPGDDGDYIRESLAFNKPGLWKKISAQLTDLGFDFKQNLTSTTTTEFPTDFVSSKITIH